MSKIQEQGEATFKTSQTRNTDLKLEAVVIPVSDVDRAKSFYSKLGWRLDADFVAGESFRVVQFTPPGSPASIHFGKGLTSAAPGAAVSGRRRHRGSTCRTCRARHQCKRCVSPCWFGTAASQRARSGGAKLRLVRLVQRPGRQHLAASGGYRAIAGTRGHGRNDIFLTG
jgi:catechol 2,3-dioxygenase-like lactoylglutathione lyase family enzyme